MIEITPLARANVAMLRLLDVPFHGIASNRDLAKRLERDESNVAKSVKACAQAGLITEASKLAERQVTDVGRDIVRAIDAEPKPAEPPPAAEGFIDVLHRDITPDPKNARKKFDPEDIAELAEGIAAVGLLQPPVVRPIEGQLTPFQLAAGERRFQAIGLLIADGRWPASKPLPCKVVTVDEATAALIGLQENMQRKDLNLMEEARAIQRTLEEAGSSTAEVATRLSKSQRWVQMRLQLLELPAIQQVAVAEGKLGFNDALKALRNIPKVREDLTPADWLLLLEIYDKAHREGTNDRARCNLPTGDGHGQMTALKERGLIYGVREEYGDEHRGLRVVTFWNSSLRPQLELKFGSLDDEALRDAALRNARTAAGYHVEPGEVRGPDGYVTYWLRGPFDRDPKLVAEAEAKEAAQLAEQEQRAAQTAAFQARQREARQGAFAFLEAQRREIAGVAADEFVSPNTREGLATAATKSMGLPLPWTPTLDGRIIAANGALAWEEEAWHRKEAAIAKAALFAASVNAAAGLPTPDPIDPDATPSREEFVRTVAAILVEDAEKETVDAAYAAEIAERGLAAFLTSEGIVYGAPSHDWTEDGAMSLAEQIRVDGLGRNADADPEGE